MGFRFYKRINLLPGISLNLSKSGPSLSLGKRGMRVTVGQRGIRHTIGIPGTGVRYEKNYKPWGKKGAGRSSAEGRSGDSVGQTDEPSRRDTGGKLLLGICIALLALILCGIGILIGTQLG